MESIILNKIQINQKIMRIAYQIYECHLNQNELIIAGIADNGFILAKRIQKALQAISPLKVSICEVTIDKKKPLNPIITSLNAIEYQNKSLVLVDDVLNSGTTLMYVVKHFLEVPLTQFKTAVLVDRNHKKYPVKADFKGISLSTSLREHVQVDFESNKVTLI
ncbi:MAG: phosphoribosyltransferase [Flavobacteriales bacterium CG03_land_8_20_14_0_80_35_15]|nr:phosphoribosyltransferase [Zetaproteobacteria bacterium]NDK18486.1 phosphoribosyltransferase [Flavobacteriales bacterium]OIO09396.1 MAG: phosphoribosyltransferase [Flavobacteriaceae bacterium CG1_02_35_72]PIV17447.1 MAG: phosphoribosyltransferase [Flavobacteriales bacterium CG03_land_8_20_14_0_80_35_15]PJA06795.1 MAG: phosphoribosyltransferase [Flavobacteriales bacterium CG_4_10_14_0_2_um_filter_35_18]